MKTSEHDDATEHHLCEHSGYEPERKTHETSLSWSHGKCGQDGGNDARRDHASEETIQLLNRGMWGRDIDELLFVAGRPVNAPEPGTSQSHQRPGHDDDEERRKGDPHDDAVSPQRKPAFRASRDLLRSRSVSRRRVHGITLGNGRTIVSS